MQESARPGERQSTLVRGHVGDSFPQIWAGEGGLGVVVVVLAPAWSCRVAGWMSGPEPVHSVGYSVNPFPHI